MKRPMLVIGIATAVSCALLVSLKSGAIALPIFSALALFLFFITKKDRKKYIVIPTICFAILLTFISFTSYNKTKIDPFTQYHNTKQGICGKIITTPKIKNGYLKFTIKTDKIHIHKTNTKINISIPYDDLNAPELFDYISISNANLKIDKNEDYSYDFYGFSDGVILNATGDYPEILWECEKTPYYYCLKLKDLISDKINLYVTKDNGAFLTGMLFGDKADLSFETTQNFRNSGISHLLAVSGLHTSLWCGLLIALLSFFKVPEKVRNAICIIFLCLFCIVSAFTPSVIRASLMMAVTLIAPFFKRTPDSFNSLGLAVTLLLISNPYTILNISFQLSAMSTAGVLIAGSYKEKINDLTKKIHILRLRLLADALIISILISIFAGVFTMPVCAYHFGSLSLAAPLSNILCIQLSFYGMMGGIISVVSSFIPFLKDFTILLFSITEFILDIVKEVASALSTFTYSTVPLYKETILAGCFLCAIIFSTGFLLNKTKNDKNILKISSTVGVLALILPSFIPVLSPYHRNSITIADCEKGIQIVVRSGLQYAYIENTTDSLSKSTYNALPKATCEKLQYYIPSFLNTDSIYNLDNIDIQCNPENILLPPDVRETAIKYNISIPENALQKTSTSFSLSDEISIEIVDTTGIKYAIIKGREKIAFVHLYGDTDFSKYIDDSTCNIAIYNGTIPTEIPENTETVIISTDANFDFEKAAALDAICNELYITAKHGSVQILL